MNLRVVSLSFWFALATWSAASGQQACPALSPPQIVPGSNIFNQQQEAQLGDAMDAGIRQTMRVVQDASLTRPLTEIVNRLAAQLPAGPPQFRVVMFEASSADAFSIPGHIYISRKMVALTRTEDEMAGILAHEMGHIVSHHSAIGASEDLRLVLNVTQVGDEKDIVDKWNQYLNNYRRRKISTSEYIKAKKLEDQHQEQADNIAISLVARAGYSTQAFVEVFDRIAETKGNTGNAWTDLFGGTTPDAKRLRLLVKEQAPLSAACVTAHAAIVPDYGAWRNQVMEFAAKARAEKLPGLVSKREMKERLRPLVDSVRISTDGKYVLAQDDSNIFVLTRLPLKNVFRIDAPDAVAAQFTPDSQGIVFQIAGMGGSPRVERWDIATQKRVELHEIYVRKGCLVSNLSPDGKTLACLMDSSSDNGATLGLDLFDTSSGTSFWHKKDWVIVDSRRYDLTTAWRIAYSLATGNAGFMDKVSRVAFSPDGHYVVARSPNNMLAMELTSRAVLGLPSSLKGLMDLGMFAFLGNGRFLGVAGSHGEKSQVVEFPSGRVIYKDIMVGGSTVSGVSRGDYVLVRPLTNNPLGVLDLKQNKLVLQSKRSAFDMWDTQCLAEREDGDLLVFELATVKTLDAAKLPEGPLGAVSASAVSPDLNWLAISQNSRGAVWNLQTGQRLYHVRGFRGGDFLGDAGFYADFPKFGQTQRTLVRLSLSSDEIKPQRTLDEKKYSVQAGKYLITLVPVSEGAGLDSNVAMELRAIATDNLLWSKRFLKERPGYFIDSNANSLVLVWLARSKAIQSLVKDDPEAAAKLAPFKDRDGIDFVEVIDLDSGKSRATMAIDTGKYSFDATGMIASGDRLVLADAKGRLLIYGLNGELKGTVLGSRAEVSTQNNLLMARTQTDEVTIYDLETLQVHAVFDFDARIAFAGFSGDGKRLLVLTANQTVYLLDTNSAGHADKVVER